jgi:hypothetical protein
MPSNEALVKEYEAARDRYLELLERVIDQKIPGVIDAVAAKCSVGEVCHGGEFRKPLDLGRPPERVSNAARRTATK